MHCVWRYLLFVHLLFIHSFTLLLSKYLLRACYMPGMIRKDVKEGFPAAVISKWRLKDEKE